MELALDSLDTTALTKAQLAEALFDQLGLNKREAKDFVDAFFEVVAAELAQGKSVKISGFGNFEVHTNCTRRRVTEQAKRSLGLLPRQRED
jgi:integration host factor subunit alpha